MELIAQGKPITVPGELIWRLSVAQYHEMIRTGILTEDDPSEDCWLTKCHKTLPISPWRILDVKCSMACYQQGGLHETSNL